MIQFLGRLHIIFLHLPIGIIMLTAFLEVVNARRWVLVPRNVLTLIYGVGCGAAILTCVSGYLLSTDGSYASGATDNHMWAGIVVALLSMVVLGWSLRHSRGIIYGSLLLTLSVVIAGHLGGSITHGENFLWASTVETKEIANPVFEIENVKEALVYEDLVKPIFAARCISCHGPDKRKGKLRMDTPDFLTSGGKSGELLIGVSSEESILYHRISLPMEDDDHMPPVEKPPLQTEEKELLKWWLDHGSTLDQTLGEVAQEDTSIYQIIQELLNKSYQDSDPYMPESKVLPARLPDVTLASITNEQFAKARELNMVVLSTGKDSPFLEVNLVNVAQMESKHWQLLEDIGMNIIRLKLSHQNVRDEDLHRLKSMEHLMYLHLDYTGVTDNGMKHISSLPQLEYLNLSGTSVSNTAFQQLSQAPSLRDIYVYKSSIMDSMGLPDGLNIVTGEYILPLLASDTTRVQ